MSAPDTFAAGFEVPLHRSLTEPILLGGAPRTVAIANGTLAAAVGLGLQLWIPGVVLWIVGHSLAVWGARVDPQFMQVFARHIKHRPLLLRRRCAKTLDHKIARRITPALHQFYKTVIHWRSPPPCGPPPAVKSPPERHSRLPPYPAV